MKKISVLLVGIFFLASCGTTETKSNEEKLVGSDKDKHGCIASAGYIWSEMNQDCIRIFEIEGRIKLESSEKNESTDATSAVVIFNEDKTNLELFLPNSTESIVLSLKEDGNYNKDNYIFKTEDASLLIDNTLVYKKAI